MFHDWKKLEVRLDAWHFLRRLACGCSTDSHQLYGTFMAGLSAPLFAWEAGDLQRLRTAKRAELERQRRCPPSADDVDAAITRQELARHCRRRIRPEADIDKDITALLATFGGAGGRDMTGLELLRPSMGRLWAEQRRHLPCLQDPPRLNLYTQVGEVIKGGVGLPVYRSARGTTSLESFHLHQARFIPGEYTCISIGDCNLDIALLPFTLLP